MKRILILLVLMLSLIVATTFALDFYVYNPKMGTVTFNHKKHQTLFDCMKCHETSGVRVIVTKDFAHKVCRECHRQIHTAKCSVCHQKPEIGH